MKKWHEGWAANIGLRAAGAGLLTGSWFGWGRLQQLAHMGSARDATAVMMLLAAIIFLCLSMGSALLFVGPGLWETVEVSERWRPLPPSAFAPDMMDREP